MKLEDSKREFAPCLTGCGNNSRKRGLCNGCYNIANRMVTDGRTTWDRLEEVGLAKASKRTIDTASVMKVFLERLGEMPDSKTRDIEFGN